MNEQTTINKLALELSAIENEKYKQWCKENPGYVMHGSSMRADVLKKASYAESMQDLLAMKRCFEIQQKSMEGRINGFGFSVDAIQQLIEALINARIDNIYAELEEADVWYMKLKRWFELQRWLITCMTRKFWDKTFEGYLFKRKRK